MEDISSYIRMFNSQGGKKILKTFKILKLKNRKKQLQELLFIVKQCCLNLDVHCDLFIIHEG